MSLILLRQIFEKLTPKGTISTKFKYNLFTKNDMQ